MSRRKFDCPPGTKGNYKRGADIASSIIGAIGAIATISALLMVKGASSLSSDPTSSEQLDSEGKSFVLTPKLKVWIIIGGVTLLGLAFLSLYNRIVPPFVAFYILATVLFSRPVLSVSTKDYIYKTATYLVAQFLALIPILLAMYGEWATHGRIQSISGALEWRYGYPTLVYIFAAIPLLTLIYSRINKYLEGY
ncbi:MAG: hypothetical protein SPC28_08760 [Alloprevotella sp.]|nr:hypothetical protein [Bacteroidales bacterium]MDY4664272.1 hypothetical protein [Alloprevotella sp.]